MAVISFRKRRAPRRPRKGFVSTFLIMGAGIAAAAMIAWFAPGGLGAGSAASPAKPAAADIIGTASVIDADTIEIHGTRIRLTGVDAPESHQKCLNASGGFYLCGSVSANALDQWIAGNPVSCTPDGKDRYDRILAACSVRGESLQGWLVSHGYAIAYRSYSTAYVPQEVKAHAAKVGVWAGRFIEPWNWRKGQRLPGEKPTKAMQAGVFAPN